MICRLLRPLRGRPASHGAAFTLIELLMVMAIISIVAALAIAQFAIYRQDGFDARATADLRNAAGAEEANFIAAYAYVSCNNCTSSELPGFERSPGVQIRMVAASQSFTGTAKHSQGRRTFTWDSTAGGLQP